MKVRYNYNVAGVVLAAAVAGAAAPALAVQPKSIPLSDGFKVTPTLDLGVTYDDNIYEANTGDTSSWVTNVTPGILLDGVQGTHHFQLDYSFDSEIIHDDTDDNNTDHHLFGSAIFGLNQFNRVELSASYDRVENIFDTNVLGENDKFERTETAAVYGFGSPASRFSADLGVNHIWFRTFNSGMNNLFREHDNVGFTATGYYQVMPKTRVLLEYDYDDYDYLLTASGLDSEREAVYAGVTWTATKRTTGTIKVGREERDFDQAGRDDTDGTSWQVDVSMQPTPRDTLALSSFQGSREGSIDEDFVDTTRYSVNWNRRLSPRFSSDIGYAYAENEYEDQLNREDEVDTIEARLRYDVYRWFTIGLGYRYEDRDSTVAVRDYDRNVYMINMNLSL